MSLNKTRKRAIAKARAREGFNVIEFANSVHLAVMKGLAKGVLAVSDSISEAVKVMAEVIQDLDLGKKENDSNEP